MGYVKLIGINGKLVLPKEEFTKAPHKLTGSRHENLMEVAGRVCYDSFGDTGGRPSKEYLEHIVESKHTSVLGHSIVRIIVKDYDLLSNWCAVFSSSPGWYLSIAADDSKRAILTANIRFLEREIDSTRSMAQSIPRNIITTDTFVTLYKIGREQAPHILTQEFDDYQILHGNIYETVTYDRKFSKEHFPILNYNWYAFEVECSRSTSHELIRHSFESAISQRSTRYVNEVDDNGYFTFLHHPFEEIDSSHIEFVKFIGKKYNSVKNSVLEKLKTKPISDFAKIKQARAAASRYIPHGLRTKLVYSVSERQLKEVIKQRNIQYVADEEIKIVAEQMLDIYDQNLKGNG